MVKEHHSNHCGIAYCYSTKDTVELAYIFKSKGLPASYYHGQLDFFEKVENEKAWLCGKSLIMCSTSVFGMGIDKPDVQFVFHITLPRSTKNYFQEAGLFENERVVNGRPTTPFISIGPKLDALKNGDERIWINL